MYITIKYLKINVLIILNNITLTYKYVYIIIVVEYHLSSSLTPKVFHQIILPT